MVANFTKKENREFFDNKLLFKTVGILLLFGIVALIVADVRIYQKKKELEEQVVAYQKRIEDIKKSSQTLKEEIDNSDNVDYLEKLGYEQFGQTRLGETEYMFVKPQKKVDAVLDENNFWNVGLWFSNAWQWIKNRF